MAEPREPRPVKLVIATLFTEEQRLAAAHAPLLAAFGTMDYLSPPFPFLHTAYYMEEMGAPLHRVFLSFAQLRSPADLAEVKLRTNLIEEQLAAAGRRTINLDPGYLDTDKFVLASTKYHGYKIYLSHGIWADLTLHYEKGRFTALPWSFPDFRSGDYERVFLRMRELYKRQLKER